MQTQARLPRYRGLYQAHKFGAAERVAGHHDKGYAPANGSRNGELQQPWGTAKSVSFVDISCDESHFCPKRDRAASIWASILLQTDNGWFDAWPGDCSYARRGPRGADSGCDSLGAWRLNKQPSQRNYWAPNELRELLWESFIRTCRSLTAWNI